MLIVFNVNQYKLFSYYIVSAFRSLKYIIDIQKHRQGKGSNHKVHPDWTLQ